MNKFLIFAVIPFLISCRYLDFKSGDEVVAKAGGAVLYSSEIRELIPPGTNPGDSIKMVEQYVNNWAIQHLLLKKAESELSKSDRDVQQELEDYKNSLLVYRFEKYFIEQRLDTLITEEECREYYDNYSANLSLSHSVVKARIIKIFSKSPNIERIKSSYKANSLEEIDELEMLCKNSAERYNNFDNKWIDISDIARETPFDVQTCEKELWEKSWMESSDSLYTYLVYFMDKVPPGDIPPYEYYSPRIREIILSKRKQELIEKLKSDLIKEAIENKTLLTNINNNIK